jgi:cytidine deaminase
MNRSVQISDLENADRVLIERALETSRFAYAPYSGFAVGAAARTKNGKLYEGANLENASFGLSMCAEVAALTRANSSGDYDVEAVAVVGHKFVEPRDATQLVTPCGRCRQLIYEASQISKVDIRVFSCSGDLGQIFESAISELLPLAFGPANLGMDSKWLTMRSNLTAESWKSFRENVSTKSRSIRFKID